MSKELETCPKCGGHADNGFSREIPPSPYYCRACMAEDRIEELERENAAQLAELHAISDAIGTSDGHSSVYWINAILADNARLNEQLADVTAERDELKADAVRYRWFRSNMHSEHACDLLESQLGNTPTPEELDAVIDAVIAKGDK